MKGSPPSVISGRPGSSGTDPIPRLRKGTTLSGGRGGLAPFIGPSGGFLLGWILSALVAGLIAQAGARRGRPRLGVLLVAAAAGLLASYAVGVPWLAVQTGSLASALAGSAVFLPGDAVKIVLAALVASVVHRALPGGLEPIRPAGTDTTVPESR
ncbi:biotin transporter BioY [Pseudonocardia sp. ICBG1122]|nr:biotin transporter BioY [Pseudonocardia pini]